MNVNIGIDWSQDKHDVAFANQVGALLAQLTIPHSLDGFEDLDRQRQRLGVSAHDCLVGLETAHNLLIDFLWAKGYDQVYVIPPNVVKSSRGRQRASGARTDQSDAILLADLLRTDLVRFQPWHPDSLLTRQIREHSNVLMSLTHDSVRFCNRLRGLLLRYYPAALALFSDLTTQISLEFIQAYPTPQAALALSYEDFHSFMVTHGYPRPRDLPRRFASLQAPQPEATSDTVQVYHPEARRLATLLLVVIRQKLSVQRDLTKLYEQHDDAPIFDSLPGLGAVLSPALLAKFGDDRRRFPSAESVQALAGTCPVTKESGKRRVIAFRRGCDRDFRHIAQQWARASLRSDSLWAASYWQRVHAHAGSESHAVRCLANRWLAIAWKLWQDKKPYDETYHLHNCAERRTPR